MTTQSEFTLSSSDSPTRSSEWSEHQWAKWRNFQAWKALPGASKVLRRVMVVVGVCAHDWRKTKVKESFRFVWETVRRELKHRRHRAGLRGVQVELWEGYRLNNNLQWALLEWISQKRPDLDGMFERRDVTPRKVKRVITVTEFERTDPTRPASCASSSCA